MTPHTQPLGGHVDVVIPRFTHGARRLWLAVLELGLIDAASNKATARAWLDEDDESHLGHFAAICRELDLQPQTVRAFAQAKFGIVLRRGEYRSIVLSGRTPSQGTTPQRRTFSTHTIRQCIECGHGFTTMFKQRKSCSERCARQARKRATGGGEHVGKGAKKVPMKKGGGGKGC